MSLVFAQIESPNIPGYAVVAIMVLSAVGQYFASREGTKAAIQHIADDQAALKSDTRRELDEIKHDSGTTKAAVIDLTGRVAFVEGKLNGRTHQ